MVMRCCGCDRHVDRSPTLKALLAGSKLIAPRLCSSCLARFKMITGATCPGCGRSGDARICADCRQWEQQGRLLHNRALFVYDAAMKQWIYQYKGLGDYRLHDAFQDLIAAQLQNARTLIAIPSESKHYDVRGCGDLIQFRDFLAVCSYSHGYVNHQRPNRRRRKIVANDYKRRKALPYLCQQQS